MCRGVVIKGHRDPGTRRKDGPFRSTQGGRTLLMMLPPQIKNFNNYCHELRTSLRANNKFLVDKFDAKRKKRKKFFQYII